MKFVNLSAEAYIDTPSSSWQKHKIAVISVKNGDFLSIFVVILPAVIIVDESLNNNKKAFKSIKPCTFSHFFDTLSKAVGLQPDCFTVIDTLHLPHLPLPGNG